MVTKPTPGATGWNVAVDEVIDIANSVADLPDRVATLEASAGSGDVTEAELAAGLATKAAVVHTHSDLLDQTAGDNRYILQANANAFAPADATTTAFAALPFRADNVTTTGAAVGKLPAVDDASPLHFALIEYFKVLAGNPDLLIAGAITRDANGAATVAPVVWPDGRPGVYTATIMSTAFPGAVDAYTVSYDGVETDFTYTQPAVTRDSTTGAVTARPAMTVA